MDYNYFQILFRLNYGRILKNIDVNEEEWFIENVLEVFNPYQDIL